MVRSEAVNEQNRLGAVVSLGRNVDEGDMDAVG
jgi:hypothetical protein